MEKKRLSPLIGLVACLACFFSFRVESGSVKAEETGSGSATQKVAVIPETDGSKWFEETILPLLLPFGSSFLGVVAAGVVILRKIVQAKRSFTDATTILREAKTETKATEERVLARQEEFEQKAEARISSLEKNVEGKIADTNEAVHTLLQVEKLAYIANPTLVSNGTAKKIAEVVDRENKN